MVTGTLTAAVYGTSIVPGPPPAFLLPLALLPLVVILMIPRRYRRRRVVCGKAIHVRGL